MGAGLGIGGFGTGKQPIEAGVEQREPSPEMFGLDGSRKCLAKGRPLWRLVPSSTLP